MNLFDCTLKCDTSHDKKISYEVHTLQQDGMFRNLRPTEEGLFP